jgi:hypothetical protein
MPKYYAQVRVDFAGEIEADSKEEAEELAWTSWGVTFDDPISYDNVYSIELEEMEDEEEEDEVDE